MVVNSKKAEKPARFWVLVVLHADTLVLKRPFWLLYEWSFMVVE